MNGNSNTRVIMIVSSGTSRRCEVEDRSHRVDVMSETRVKHVCKWDREVLWMEQYNDARYALTTRRYTINFFSSQRYTTLTKLLFLLRDSLDDEQLMTVDLDVLVLLRHFICGFLRGAFKISIAATQRQENDAAPSAEWQRQLRP